jgi:transporter family-2 protein
VRGLAGILLRAHPDEPGRRPTLVPGLGGRLTALFLLGSVVLGTGLTLQIAMNTRMRAFASGPFGAALMSFVVGALALAMVLALARAPWPGRELAQAPWWTWCGGLMGALYVLGAVLIAPRIGPGPLLALVVMGQMSAALVLEHYGWLGTVRHPVSVVRILGVVLIVVGAALVRLF